MNRIPDFQIDLMFSDIPPQKNDVAEKAVVTEAPEKTEVADTKESTSQPVPLSPRATGVLEPISASQTFVLVMFGLVSFVMLIAMVRFGSKNNYGD